MFKMLLFILLIFNLSCTINQSIEMAGSSSGNGNNESIQPPQFKIVSALTGTEALFSSSDSAHCYFECKVDNGQWFQCSSPFNVNDNGVSLPQGYRGSLYLRSVSSSGNSSDVVEKHFYMSDKPKGFVGKVYGHIDLGNDKHLVYGELTGVNPYSSN